MKKFLINSYKYRLHKFVEAQQDLNRYWCLHFHGSTVISDFLEINVAFQELFLECYKTILPKKWTEE